jgi:hypothetical protein
LAIDPHNPNVMSAALHTGGESWSRLYNQPTAQFYHIAAFLPGVSHRGNLSDATS